MTEQSTGDVLVADYLARVRRAGAGLPPGRVDELVDDLSAHIAAARAELAPESELAVRTILDRLGDPAAIAAEAAVGEPPAWGPPGSVAAPRRRALKVALLVLLGVVVIAPILVCAIGGLAFYQFGTVIDNGPMPVPTPSVVPVQSTT